MNRKVRAIIVDGIEIMTSLTAVEIADRLRTYDDLKEENESHKKEMNYYKKQYYNCKSRIDKALIYLGKCDWNDKHCFENLINMLNGSDEK